MVNKTKAPAGARLTAAWRVSWTQKSKNDVTWTLRPLQVWRHGGSAQIRARVDSTWRSDASSRLTLLSNLENQTTVKQLSIADVRLQTSWKCKVLFTLQRVSSEQIAHKACGGWTLALLTHDDRVQWLRPRFRLRRRSRSWSSVALSFHEVRSEGRLHGRHVPALRLVLGVAAVARLHGASQDWVGVGTRLQSSVRRVQIVARIHLLHWIKNVQQLNKVWRCLTTELTGRSEMLAWCMEGERMPLTWMTELTELLSSDEAELFTSHELPFIPATFNLTVTHNVKCFATV